MATQPVPIKHRHWFFYSEGGQNATLLTLRDTLICTIFLIYLWQGTGLENWEYTGHGKGLNNPLLSLIFVSAGFETLWSAYTQYCWQTTTNKRSFLDIFVANRRQETCRICLVSILLLDFQQNVVKSREQRNLDMPYYTIVGWRQASERQLSKQYLLSSFLICNAGNLKWTIMLWGPQCGHWIKKDPLNVRYTE